jgi:hypothetical protein
VATVQQALPLACKRNAALCERVGRYLEQYARDIALTDGQIEGAAGKDTKVPLPNRHGEALNDRWTAQVTAHWRPMDYVLIGAGTIARSGHVTPTGSVVSVGVPRLQLDVGYRDHWLSPLQDSGFLMSTQAPTLPSVTLSNSQPLTRARVTYEAFLARMARSDRIAFQDRFTAGHPLLAGMHLAIQPAPGWSLAANRQFQYGGGERGGKGFRNLIKAFVNPSAFDNTHAGASTDGEFGNQQAAWTSSFIFPGRVPFVVSLEYAGEDTSHSGSGRLGNSALTAGIRIPRLPNGMALNYELSEWQNGWYVHHLYADGMTTDGHVLGHWAADQRVFGDGVGARSQMLQLGWTADSGRTIDLQLRSVKNQGYSGIAYRRALEVGARYSMPWKSSMLGGEVLVGRDVFGEKYLRVSGFARYLDGAHRYAGDVDGDASVSDPDATAIFVDIGASASRVRAELRTLVPQPTTTHTSRVAPHLAIGARRAVSARSDLGVRVEYDRVDARTLIAVRALDYRYRLHGPFAVSAFVGAARYDLATPAYGYYVGAGVQWRDILPRWDLNFDLRYGEKIARDRLLPQELLQGTDDTFHDIYGPVLSMSYRW